VPEGAVPLALKNRRTEATKKARSFLTVPATTFISGTFECMIQETTRSSSFPADSLSGQA
jgi:hypothetical protein